MVTYSIPYKVDEKAEQRFYEFVSRHEHHLANPVIKGFLNHENDYNLFVQAVCYPSPQNCDRLERAFQRFYIEIRLIHYLSKVLWRYAKDYRAKTNRRRSHYLLMLDRPVQSDEPSGMTYKSQLPDWGNVNDPASSYGHPPTLEESIENDQLFRGVRSLTQKQLKMLELYFLHDQSQKEIADAMGVSQQSVSKTMNHVFKKLKAFCDPSS